MPASAVDHPIGLVMGLPELRHAEGKKLFWHVSSVGKFGKGTAELFQGQKNALGFFRGIGAGDIAVDVFDVALGVFRHQDVEGHGRQVRRRPRMRTKASATGSTLPSSTALLVSANTLSSARVSWVCS